MQITWAGDGCRLAAPPFVEAVVKVNLLEMCTMDEKAA